MKGNGAQKMKITDKSMYELYNENFVLYSQYQGILKNIDHIKKHKCSDRLVLYDAPSEIKQLLEKDGFKIGMPEEVVHSASSGKWISITWVN